MENSVIMFADNLSLEIGFLSNSDDPEWEPLGVYFKNPQTDDFVKYDRENLQELIDGLQQMANQLPE